METRSRAWSLNFGRRGLQQGEAAWAPSLIMYRSAKAGQPRRFRTEPVCFDESNICMAISHRRNSESGFPISSMANQGVQ